MLWCCITPEREQKTRRIMDALAQGFGSDAGIVFGEPPNTTDPFAIWGQLWLSERVLPRATTDHQPYWHIDNGFWQPARGGAIGYYRMTYRGLAPIQLKDISPARANASSVLMSPWRASGEHILLAYPGMGYGRALGMDMAKWVEETEPRLRAATDRPIIVRAKNSDVPLAQHLENCWALVTHSSNVAVDAVLKGIPVFVAASSPAAPVGNLDLADLEHPRTPERTEWWASLMCQQFTLPEMSRGVPREFMRAIARQTDGD